MGQVYATQVPLATMLFVAGLTNESVSYRFWWGSATWYALFYYYFQSTTEFVCDNVLGDNTRRLIPKSS